MNTIEFKEKKEKVLQKFSEAFIEKHYNSDATFRAVMEMLIRDEDPYTIIETLIEQRSNLINQMIGGGSGYAGQVAEVIIGGGGGWGDYTGGLYQPTTSPTPDYPSPNKELTSSL